MKDKILSVVKHYGILHQLKYMSTEQFELNEAIFEYENFKDDFTYDEEDYKNHIIEELADNLFMLKQIQYYYGITDEEIQKTMNYKIDRQIERIEKIKKYNL